MLRYKLGGMDVQLPFEIIIAFILGLFLLYAVSWLLLVPMRFVWRLLAGGVLGGFALWLINQFGALIGLEVAINPFTALIVGFLGVPGAALVVALQLLL